MTVQAAEGASVAPQVVVERNGGCAGNAADGQRPGTAVGEGESVCCVAWPEVGWPKPQRGVGDQVSSNGQNSRSAAKALHIAGRACSVDEPSLGVALAKRWFRRRAGSRWKVDDGERAASEGRQGRAWRRRRKRKLAGKSESDSHRFCGEVVEREESRNA